MDLADIMERAEVESEAGEQDGADGVAEAPIPIVNSGAAMHPDAEPFYPQHGSNHPEAGEDQSQGEGTWQFRHKGGPSQPPLARPDDPGILPR